MNSSGSILLVEDNDELRSAVRELFEYENLIVEEARNGEVALNILRENKNISLIFLDLNMPVMNGEEFLNCAKREKLLDSIQVVIFATKIPQRLLKDHLSIQKPAEIEHLINLGKTYCRPQLSIH